MIKLKLVIPQEQRLFILVFHAENILSRGNLPACQLFTFYRPVAREHHLFSNSREDPERAMIFASS